MSSEILISASCQPGIELTLSFSEPLYSDIGQYRLRAGSVKLCNTAAEIRGEKNGIKCCQIAWQTAQCPPHRHTFFRSICFLVLESDTNCGCYIVLHQHQHPLGLWPGSSTPNDEAGSIDCWPFTDAILGTLRRG